MKIPTLIYSLIYLCAGFCCGGTDDGIPAESYGFETPGLVKIENEKTTYSKGDTLWVSANIPVIMLNQDGEKVNVSELVGGSDRAYISFDLYWVNGFEKPSPIALSENELIVETGEVDIQYHITSTAFLNAGNFTSKFGIILKDEGSYFLGSAINPDKPLEIYVDTRNGNSVFIETTFANPGSNPNRFSFTVE